MQLIFYSKVISEWKLEEASADPVGGQMVHIPVIPNSLKIHPEEQYGYNLLFIEGPSSPLGITDAF